MLYVLLGEDVADSLAQRQAVREEHLRRLEVLRDEGRLLLAGPLPRIDASDPGAAGFSGSLVVADFPSLEEAQRWLEEDPYSTTGVFRRSTVKPFKKVLP